MSVAVDRVELQPGQPQLTVADAARIIRESMKDKRYRATPIGELVGRFMRAAQLTLASNTRDSYETTLRLFALRFADFHDLGPFLEPEGADLLVEFLVDRWGDSSDETKRNRIAALRAFFAWAVESGRIDRNPAQRIKAPKAKKHTDRRAYPVETLRLLVASQDLLRDRTCCLILAVMGLRKNELAQIRVRDVDLASNAIFVHGKGGKNLWVPIESRELRESLYLLIQAEHDGPDEFLLHPRGRRRERMNQATVHRWFKRCCARAGVGDLKLHEIRHSAADLLYRTTGDTKKAQDFLRHESLATTERYLHPNDADQRAGLRLVDDLWRDA